jgi:hypothetical protein
MDDGVANMKDGFYWARGKDGGDETIVEVIGDCVWTSGSDDFYHIEYFERSFEFISKEPLTPPETP